ncbi:helix-turn-helix transcriptional regulator [Pigmentibacter sp. JX0631]|uniref:helix-turn-helix domain-containing protein n=1 Tax=Pigmentibacter sp. JX0631 TaxID=2976982 RepID=UPI00246990D7|nr:helix-turn-helix transcriptional regulator [Pigmentibacter sp. JX0631]WGL60036.1 helix-turn-helix transcriptional regulator [Pigmentibacter sp. JX0631]
MISNIVKILRKNAGLTQKEAAEILKIEQRSWERYEAGDRIPSIQNLELFCIKKNQDFNEYRNKINDYLNSKKKSL